MSTNLPYLLLALALLLPPLPLPGEFKKKLTDRPPSPNLSGMLQSWQNWADLVRAGVGVFILIEFAIVAEPEIAGSNLQSLLLKSVILGFAVLIQSLRWVDHLRTFAPSFYLSGLTIVLSNPVVGGFAVFVGWLFAIAGKNANYQLPAMAVALPITSYVVGLDILHLLNAGLVFLPLLINFLLQKPLLNVVRIAL